MKSAYKTRHESASILLVSLLLIGGLFPNSASALSVEGACAAVADRLVANQHSSGAWLGEEDYTGSIVAGLIRAYEVTGDSAYLASAALGIRYILEIAGGNFFGDEAYALARLTEVTGETAYAAVALEFYNGLDTAAYISGFEQTDRSNAVFYIAHHALAAHKVGAVDAKMWRAALIDHLRLIDDDLAYYPVMSLGVATWALAQTGPMDETKVDPNGVGQASWAAVTLRDLPAILAGHQVISDAYEGSFYYRFDHASPGPGFEAGGYTEDTVFGVLGLIAADAAEPVAGVGWDFDQEIQNAREALAGSVSATGFVWEHVALRIGDASVWLTYGGELLETMPAKAGPTQ